MIGLDDILTAIQISRIAEVHGVKLNRTRRRGVAVWRGGKNFSVAFNDDKNVYHDFVTGEGGGVVSFVTATSVLRQEAGPAMARQLRWRTTP